MNNMRILICIIFTFAVGMFVYFFVNTTTQSADDKSIEELEYELEQAYIDADLNDPILTSTVVEEDLMKQADAAEAKAIADAEIARQADELEKAQLAEKARMEAEALEAKTPKVSDDRLALIAQALVMATVTEYDPDSGITVVTVNRPENVLPGQILGIRRKQTGILGRLRIDDINNGQAFADPIMDSFFIKPIDIQVGDELIIIP